MHFTPALLLAVAGLAAAQSSTSAAAPAASSASASGCGSAIDAIIKSCIQSTSIQLNACAANDWRCMCKAQINVVTCYNSCASDPAGVTARQQETSWCNAAKIQPSSSSINSGGKTTAAAAGTSTTATRTTHNTAANSGYATGSMSGSAAAQSSTGAASGLTPAGGLVAAVFGLALL